MEYWERVYQKESNIEFGVIELNKSMSEWPLKNEWIERASEVFFQGRE